MFVPVAGVNWFYTSEGHGVPILFLHGGFDTCANYSRLFEKLADSFRVIAPDRRGHGRTGDTDAPFDHTLMAEEVLEFADTLNLELFHLIGYSDGANIGLQMAARFPERIASLIAISGNYKGHSGMSAGWLETQKALSLEFVREHMPEVLGQYAELNPRPKPEEFIDKTRELWNRETIIGEDVLSSIRVPTLITGGDRDIVLPEQLIAMQRLIPNSSLMILPYSGHFIFQDFAWSSIATNAARTFKSFIATRFAEHNTNFG